ncbi:hypothetical protein [Tellurirhabdus bombi]|uniref:hypothetical protein n=1 Tax=Tellurirhabdus bombi TaxID=2907205 RepID=UPI001F3E5A21|nr:hypothetical protein [Tellurirhabdus bombi]
MNRRNQRKGITQGRYLEDAIKAQGDSILGAAKKLGLSRAEKFYNHINDKTYLSFESVAELLALYPTLNPTYIFTGKGPMKLDKSEVSF